MNANLCGRSCGEKSLHNKQSGPAVLVDGRDESQALDVAFEGPRCKTRRRQRLSGMLLLLASLPESSANGIGVLRACWDRSWLLPRVVLGVPSYTRIDQAEVQSRVRRMLKMIRT